MPTTTTGVLPPEVQVSFNQMILSTPVPNYIHRIPAMREHMPARGGNIARFRRYNPLASATVPLGNTGVDPDAQLLTAVDIDAEIQFYGTYIIINEQVTLQAQDNVLNNAAIRLGDSLRRTEDELTRNMLAGTAAFVNATFGANGDVPTEITQPDIDKVTTMLINNNAHMFLSGIEGDLKFGTAPVRMAFIALANSAIIPDLQNPANVPNFIAKSQYPDQSRTIESEWGAVNNVRFLVSSIGSVIPNSSMNGRNVYNVFVVAKEAYGIVEQDQYTAQFLYRPAIYSGPLAQNVTAGYKFGSAYRILNDAWVISLRVTLRLGA